MSDLSHDEMLQLTRAILNMLDDWGVQASDQLSLLGLETLPVRDLRKMRDSRALPDEPEVMTRVEHLISIADALRTTFPFSRQMGKMWMHKPNRRFRQRTPLATMIEDGMTGLISVRSHLDCAFGWDQSGSKS